MEKSGKHFRIRQKLTPEPAFCPSYADFENKIRCDSPATANSQHFPCMLRLQINLP